MPTLLTRRHAPALGFILLAFGCSDTPSDSPNNDETGYFDAGTEDEEVIARMSALGFRPEDVVVDGSAISVDGDLILDRDKLLAGAYPARGPVDGNLHQKSHYVGPPMPISWDNAINIKLTWATGDFAPSTTIKNAIIHAAGDYNSTCTAVNNQCLISISQNNTGPAIKVHSVPASSWPPRGCTANSVGCADFPASGRPGANLYIKRDKLTAACANWTADGLAHTARHELGHALGFTHPGVGTLVEFTTSQVRTPSGTIMNTKVFDSSCRFSPTILTTDDKTGLRSVY